MRERHIYDLNHKASNEITSAGGVVADHVSNRAIPCFCLIKVQDLVSDS
jgi:hypothetical protein